MMQKNDVLIFTRFYPPAFRGGGPIRTLEALVEENRDEYEIAVIASDRDLGATSRLSVPNNSWTEKNGAHVYFASADQLSMYLAMLTRARRMKPRLVYINSFFDRAFSIIPQILYRFSWFGKARLLIAPRGEMGKGALRIKPRRKRLFIRTYRLLGLDRNVIWHASSHNEAQDIKSIFGEASQIVIKKDETRLPKVADLPFESREETRLVFVSRLARIKGLDILLQAASMLDAAPKLSLDIYGIAEDEAYVRECRRLAEGVPKDFKVTWKGELSHDEVRSTVRQYDYLVLPTKGENFGHIIAEALSVSVPVISTKETPWTSVLEAGGGLAIHRNNEESWREVLRKLSCKSVEEKDADRNAALQAYNSWMAGNNELTLFAKLEQQISLHRRTV